MCSICPTWEGPASPLSNCAGTQHTACTSFTSAPWDHFVPLAGGICPMQLESSFLLGGNGQCLGYPLLSIPDKEEQQLSPQSILR